MGTKYKSGDKVMIKKKLRKGRTYRMANDFRVGNSVVDEMKMWVGRIATIDSVLHGQYTLRECSNHWTDEMFEEVNRK